MIKKQNLLKKKLVVDENFVISSWIVAEEFLDNGCVDSALKVLLVITKKVDFNGLEIYEIKTRLRIGILLNKYTENFKEAKEEVEKALIIAKELYGECSNKEKLKELETLRFQIYKELIFSYHQLNIHSFCETVLKNAISFAKTTNRFGWLHFLQFEYLRINKEIMEDEKKLLTEVNAYIHDLRKQNWDKKEKNVLLLLYQIIKLHIHVNNLNYFDVEAVRTQIGICNNFLNKETEGGVEEIQNSKKLKVNEAFFIKNYDFLTLSLYLFVLKGEFYLQTQKLAELEIEYLKSENFFMLFQKLQSKRANGLEVNQSIRWLRVKPVIALCLVFNVVAKRMRANKVDDCQSRINDGIKFLNSTIKRRVVGKQNKLDINTNNEVIIMLHFKQIFLFNKITTFLTKSEFSNAIITIKNAKSEQEEYNFLKERYFYHLEVLHATYFALIGESEKAKSKFKNIRTEMIEKEDSIQNDQLFSWMKVIEISIDVFEYSKNKTEEMKKELFSRLDILQEDEKTKRIIGLDFAIRFLRESVCFLLGVENQNLPNLRVMHETARKVLVSKQCVSRILELLGKVYTIQNSISLAKRCFEHSLKASQESKDLISENSTFEFIQQSSSDDGDLEKSFSILKTEISNRINDSKAIP